MEDVNLKFPVCLRDVAKELTAPKPDLLFGSHLNASTLKSEYFPETVTNIFSLDDRRVRSLLQLQEYDELCCGLVGRGFSFPTFTVERKSDSGALYYAQNQLLGTLRCMVESQMVAKRRVDKNLPVLSLGIVNVGNWVEFWGCWNHETMETVSPTVRTSLPCRPTSLQSTLRTITCLVFGVVSNLFLYQSELTNG